MQKDLIRIVIADDHVIMVNALRDIVNKFQNCIAEKIFHNGHEVIECIRSGYPADILLTDLNMPGVTGFDIAAWIKEYRPDIRMIAVTMYNNEYLFRELFDLGFSAILSKNTSTVELETAIQTVYSGEYYMHNLSALGILRADDHAEGKGKNAFKVFSKKESATLKLLVTDLSYKEIASELNISVRSVETYKDAFCQKFNVYSQIGIASYAVKNGLIFG